jgi:hypothetical protein
MTIRPLETSPVSPFQTWGVATDIFKHQIVPFLEVRDLCHFSAVCKSWREVNFWRNLSVGLGFPLVEGEVRDLQEDFITLYKTAGIGARMIGHYLGEMVGKVPTITKERFEWLSQKDRWDETKCNRDTFEWHVVPSHIRRMAGDDFALKGNSLVLDPDEVEEKELEVPLSLQNLRLLSARPLNGTESLPIFDDQACEKKALDQSEPHADGVRIWFTRKEAINSGSSSWTLQSAVQDKGKEYQITSAFVETWRRCFHLFAPGTLSSSNSAGIFACTSTRVDMGNGSYPVAIGSPPMRIYAHTRSFALTKQGHIGVFPCVLAEIPELAQKLADRRD